MLPDLELVDEEALRRPRGNTGMASKELGLPKITLHDKCGASIWRARISASGAFVQRG